MGARHVRGSDANRSLGELARPLLYLTGISRARIDSPGTWFWCKPDVAARVRSDCVVARYEDTEGDDSGRRGPFTGPASPLPAGLGTCGGLEPEAGGAAGARERPLVERDRPLVTLLAARDDLASRGPRGLVGPLARCASDATPGRAMDSTRRAIRQGGPGCPCDRPSPWSSDRRPARRCQWRVWRGRGRR